ncbi:glycosyltransferase family 2 protein [Bacillus carboniphilus]|uniref:Glycosyltransferase family 2 protein n=1 Tax=Bacillus carboniphilus TaxID=86663 RepID=A0ABP3FJA2_9BACI
MADLTAIILTKNEELNIKECINSIKAITKRIIVIDSFSNDRTVEIAKELGADVYQNRFINYSKQFKYGLYNTAINTKWVLRIDADERLTKESAEEIETLTKLHTDDDVNGLILRFKVQFMGRYLKYGGVYPFRKLLVFKHGIGDIEDRNMDEHIVLSKGRAIELKNDSLHYDFKNLTYWIAKHNWYASREVKDYFESRYESDEKGDLDRKAKIKRIIKFKIYYKLPMGLRNLLYFIYRYVFKLGFLDGKEGFIYNFLQAYWYRFLVDAKIYEHEKMGGEFEKTGELNV